MTDILIPKKNIIMDATLLSSLMSCARMTDLRFNMNLGSIEGKSNSLEVGSLVHKVVEVMLLNQMNGLSRKDAIGQGMIAGEMYIRGCEGCAGFKASDEISSPTCGHEINEYPGLKNTPPDNSTKPARIGYKWALQTCEQYFDYYKNDSWITLEVEAVKSEILFEDDEYRVMWKAKFDWIVDTSQGIIPVDHKTMKQNRDTVSLNNQFIGQCILTRSRNVIIDKIGFQTSLKPEDKFKRVPISYSSERLIEWQSDILPYYAKQLYAFNEANYYPANFTHCENKYGFCNFKKVCELDPNLREQELKHSFVVIEKWDPINVEKDED